jgi:MFS family permease
VRRLLLFVSVVVFVDTMFYAAITPLLPTLAAEHGLQKGAAGVLAGAYAAGVLLGSVPAGWLAARVGARPTVLLGLGLMAAASVAFAVVDDVVVLEVARFAQGIGGGASWAGALAWLIGAAPPGRRGELIGSALGATIAGAMCGPLLGALAEAIGREIAFAAVGVAGGALAVWALHMPAHAPAGGDSPRALAGALRDRRVAAGMWLTIVPGLLFGTLGVLAPLRLDELGASAALIAGAFLVAAGLEAIVSPVVGRASDRHGRMAPSLAGLAGGAVAAAVLPWPSTVALLAAAVVVASGMAGLLWAPAMAMLSEGAEALGVGLGLAFGLSNVAWAAGQTAGSVASARLAEATGDRLPYLIIAVLFAVTLVALGVRPGRRRSSPWPLRPR